MKLKILVKIIEKLFGIVNNGDEPRADMFLPDRLLAMSVIFVVGGLVSLILAITSSLTWLIGVIICFAFGIAALLCWKNQSIHIISDEQFTYTTMFGKVRTYSFSDIQGLRRNQDSLTLFVANEKVHIESMAIISERLVERINNALEEMN
jgi:hypothetical protein